ncbi:hypothetical protein SAY87_028395 [Trapa incisa]|uniref:Oleosin n=1 Tax=Trapa incisa TaxID=236973 RepID=A0AAN7L205_9MYRT|nr:hypothetical protein SAY87_028395 [Trapa incisa]
MSDQSPTEHDLPQTPPRPGTTTVTLHHLLPRQIFMRIPGLLTLAVSGGIFLLLTGVTVAVILVGLIVFSPIILITSPIWVPAAAILFAPVFGLLSFCCLGLAVLAGLAWLYRYLKGSHPPGSYQAELSRRRIYDTARHVKEYASSYGGYLRNKLKDVAPGA